MASSKEKGGNPVIVNDFVSQDKIWRTRIVNEQVASKKWPNNWSFMAASNQEPVEAVRRPTRRESCDFAPGYRRQVITPIDKYIKVEPSPKGSYPRTDSGLIGWRSAPAYRLERYGNYGKQKGDFIKSMGWPREGVF